MSLDNNDKNNREFNEFLQSLQDEVNENDFYLKGTIDEVIQTHEQNKGK